MSNQRGGTWKPASMKDGGASERMLYDFFKTASALLADQGKDDEAFYFEQVVDYMSEGGRISSDSRTVARILGL